MPLIAKANVPMISIMETNVFPMIFELDRTKILKISGIISGNGKNDAKRLNINIFRHQMMISRKNGKRKEKRI